MSSEDGWEDEDEEEEGYEMPLSAVDDDDACKRRAAALPRKYDGCCITGLKIFTLLLRLHRRRRRNTLLPQIGEEGEMQAMDRGRQR